MAEYQQKHKMAMWQACAETGDEKVILEILGHGFPVNTDLDGTGTPGDYTPLHAASEKGFSDIVDLLIDKHANLGARANKGRTPLHLAALHGHGLAVSKLLEAGANLRLTDKDDQTALMLAEHFCPQGDKYEVLNLLNAAAAAAMMKPKSPMLGPRKQAQLNAMKLADAARAEEESKEARTYMEGAFHLSWQPRNHMQGNVYNIGTHGTAAPHRGSIQDEYTQPYTQPIHTEAYTNLDRSLDKYHHTSLDSALMWSNDMKALHEMHPEEVYPALYQVSLSHSAEEAHDFYYECSCHVTFGTQQALNKHIQNKAGNGDGVQHIGAVHLPPPPVKSLHGGNHQDPNHSYGGNRGAASMSQGDAHATLIGREGWLHWDD